MKEDFPKDLARILKHEGGRVDHPKDPGGRTNKGVTQRVYSAWLRMKGLPIADVWTIKPEHVAAIYKTEYWDKVWGDKLPTGVAYATFDAAVNSGVGRSILWLQIALGNVRADSAMGPATLKAVLEHPNHDLLIAKMIDLRLKFVRALKTYKTFGKGWESRYAHVRAGAQAEAMGTVGPAPLFFADGNQKANIEDKKSAPPTKPATTVISASASGGAVGQVTTTLNPFAELSPHVNTVIAVITLLAFVAAALAGAYLWYANKKRKELDDALNVLDDRPIPASTAGAPDEDEAGNAMILHLAEQA